MLFEGSDGCLVVQYCHLIKCRDRIDIVEYWKLWYNSDTESQRSKGGLPSSVEGLTLQTKERRAMLMVTYADLFQFCIFIVALVGLCYTVFRGRK